MEHHTDNFKTPNVRFSSDPSKDGQDLYAHLVFDRCPWTVVLRGSSSSVVYRKIQCFKGEKDRRETSTQVVRVYVTTQSNFETNRTTTAIKLPVARQTEHSRPPLLRQRTLQLLKVG